jgi:hypothetical protein
MRIILCTQKDVFDQKIGRMVQWEFTFPSWKYSCPDEPLFSDAEHWSVHYDFWLGSSGDNKEWTMAAIPIEDRPGGGDEQAEYEKMKSTCPPLCSTASQISITWQFKERTLPANSYIDELA